MRLLKSKVLMGIATKANQYPHTCMFAEHLNDSFITASLPLAPSFRRAQMFVYEQAVVWWFRRGTWIPRPRIRQSCYLMLAVEANQKARARHLSRGAEAVVQHGSSSHARSHARSHAALAILWKVTSAARPAHEPSETRDGKNLGDSSTSCLDRADPGDRGELFVVLSTKGAKGLAGTRE